MDSKNGSPKNLIAISARSGYAARGIVYLIIGGLATIAALGSGGQTSGSRDALETLLTEPFGSTLLVIMALGLFGYAAWRIIQASLDTDNHGTDGKGLAIRASLVVSAILHVFLGFFTFTLAFALGDSSGGSSGGGKEGFTSWLLQQPFGVWLVALVGVVVIAAGIAHGIKGWKAKFEEYMRIPGSMQPWAQRVCRFGLVTRGVALVIVGGFFLLAAYQTDPSEAGGLGEVFSTVRSLVFGKVLLGIMAVGLFAFGAYSLMEAAFRQVNAPTADDISRSAPW